MTHRVSAPRAERTTDGDWIVTVPAAFLAKWMTGSGSVRKVVSGNRARTTVQLTANQFVGLVTRAAIEFHVFGDRNALRLLHRLHEMRGDLTSRSDAATAAEFNAIVSNGILEDGVLLVRMSEALASLEEKLGPASE